MVGQAFLPAPPKASPASRQVHWTIDRCVDKERSTAGRAGILPAPGQLVANDMGAASSAPTVDPNFFRYTTANNTQPPHEPASFLKEFLKVG